LFFFLPFSLLFLRHLTSILSLFALCASALLRAFSLLSPAMASYGLTSIGLSVCATLFNLSSHSLTNLHLILSLLHHPLIPNSILLLLLRLLLLLLLLFQRQKPTLLLPRLLLLLPPPLLL
jgi:hypothetical protein